MLVSVLVRTLLPVCDETLLYVAGGRRQTSCTWRVEEEDERHFKV